MRLDWHGNFFPEKGGVRLLDVEGRWLRRRNREVSCFAPIGPNWQKSNLSPLSAPKSCQWMLEINVYIYIINLHSTVCLDLILMSHSLVHYCYTNWARNYRPLFVWCTTSAFSLRRPWVRTSLPERRNSLPGPKVFAPEGQNDDLRCFNMFQFAFFPEAIDL